MLNRKLSLSLQILQALLVLAVFTALDMVRFLLMLLVVAAFVINIAKALPIRWHETVDHSMVAAYFLCAMGEWKRCESVANWGGDHD